MTQYVIKQNFKKASFSSTLEPRKPPG